MIVLQILWQIRGNQNLLQSMIVNNSQFSLAATSLTSALEVIFYNEMRYINLRFTYLFTYLLTYVKAGIAVYRTRGVATGVYR